MQIDMSEDVTALVKALVTAKGKFGDVTKNKVNPYFKNSYADLETVLDAIEPALLDNGLVVVQPTSVHEGKIRVTTLLLHTSGQYIGGEYELHPVKEDPQGEGSALTYARRYALMALLGLAPEDDDGQGASRRAPERPATPPRDWIKEADAATTSDDVKNLGRAAHAVGEFEGRVGDHLRARVAVLETEEADKAAELAKQELAAEPV